MGHNSIGHNLPYKATPWMLAAYFQTLPEAFRRFDQLFEDLTVVSTINSLEFSPKRYWLAIATDVSVEAKWVMTNSCSMLSYVVA